MIEEILSVLQWRYDLEKEQASRRDKLVQSLKNGVEINARERDNAEKRAAVWSQAISVVKSHTENKPKIVCLCGSTRFYKQFQEANYRETMNGKIVLSVGFYPHAQNEMHGEQVGITVEQKCALDELHKRKIDLADEILVLNIGGYIGDSTRSEIAYADSINKPIYYLEN